MGAQGPGTLPGLQTPPPDRLRPGGRADGGAGSRPLELPGLRVLSKGGTLIERPCNL